MLCNGRSAWEKQTSRADLQGYLPGNVLSRVVSALSQHPKAHLRRKESQHLCVQHPLQLG